MYLGDILVLGLGSSGRAAAVYCADWLDSDVGSVTLVDANDSPTLRERAEELAARGVTVLLGTDMVPGSYDLCIASPGIPPHAPIMAAAHAACGEVVSELEFAYRRSTNPWLAVTGTNGKTTTTALVTHLLTASGLVARSVGNFGPPAIAAVAEAGVGEVLVAEVSSFQLALIDTFHPRVATLLNITPDHVGWHGSLENYASDKARVFENLGSDDVAVVDVDDPGSAPFAEMLLERGVCVVRVSRNRLLAGGAALSDGMLVLDTPHGVESLTRADELTILGSHNVSNALAAAASAHYAGASISGIREGLRTFEPIEHRLEPIGRLSEVEWYNDSKATNPDAVSKAVDAFAGRSIVVLLGGRSKGTDFRPLAEQIAAADAAVITFGEAGAAISDAFIGLPVSVTNVGRLADAVEAARGIARAGDAVVLSPACASFDEFDNYEQRGRVFKALVRGSAEVGAS